MKILLLFTVFIFAAVPSCNDEDADLMIDPESRYQLQNDSGNDLFLLTENGFQEVARQSVTLIGSEYNSTSGARIPPSKTILFNSIELYEKEGDDFIRIYDQEPVDDSLWSLEESSQDGYELYVYTLLISDEFLN